MADPIAHIAGRIGSGGRCLLMPNGGNLGDSLIAAATIQRLRAAGIPWCLIRGQRHTVTPLDVLAFGGGGSLVSLYEGGVHCVRSLLTLGAPVVVLPQSINGHSEFWSSVSGVTVFCRDARSLECAARFSGVRAMAADDMALGLDVSVPPYAACQPGSGAAGRGRLGTLLAFRGDAESVRPVPPGNFDVSVAHEPSFISAESIEADAAGFLRAVSRYSEIRTDRLHVAIAGALLGIPTLLEDNVYGKNRAVFEASISGRFPWVRMSDGAVDQNA